MAPTAIKSSIFVQQGGASPLNKPLVGGLNGASLAIDSPKFAGSSSEPIYERDPRNYGAFRVIANKVSPPGGFDEFKLMMRPTDGVIPPMLMRPTCPQDFYVLRGDCADPTNFLAGWNHFVEVYPQTILSGDIDGVGVPFDSDAVMELSQSRKITGEYFPIGAMVFGSDTQALRAITSVTYGRRNTACITCIGTPETNDIYALIAGDGTTNAPSVRYSTDGGKTWANLSITGIAATETALKILATPSALIVVTDKAASATQSGYYVSPINQQTGVPSSTWTKVTTGFVVNGLATDAVLDLNNTLWISGALGYIYSASGDQLTGGVSIARTGATGGANVTSMAVSPDGKVLAASLSSGDVLLSINNGVIWAVAPTVAGVSADDVMVIDRNIMFVNVSNALYVTINGGTTWTLVTTGLTTITATLAVSRNVLYVAGTTAAGGVILSSWNGGYSWTSAAPRFPNLPTASAINALAIPFSGSAGLRSNNLVAGGLQATNKGLIAYAAATVQ